jgi:molybdate transport system permease protein
MNRAGRWWALGTGLSVALLLAFVLLPVLAIYLRVPPGRLLSELHSRKTLDALWVSARCTGIALALIVAVGTPAAYVLATRKFPGRTLLITLVELPLVLPPAVAGVGLFAAFGRFGLLGSPLRAVGLEISFTQVAVVMALTFVAMPFFVRQAIAAFASVDRQLLAASRTLGAGPARTFVRVAIPLARPGLSAGAALAWARALGEFGATIVFAGSLQGKTQTLPLAIFEDFASGDVDGALAIAALLVAVSGGLLLGIRMLLRGRDREEEEAWTPGSRSASAIA